MLAASSTSRPARSTPATRCGPSRRGAAPVDKPARTATVTALRRALAPADAALDGLDGRLAKVAPTGRRGATVRDGLRSTLAPVGDAYAEARARVRDLADVAPAKVPAATARVLRALDRADRRGDEAHRPARADGAQVVAGHAVHVGPGVQVDRPRLVVRAPTTMRRSRPHPPSTRRRCPAPSTSPRPRLLLPGRYRPTADIAALAAQTAMTGRARTFFYGAMPLVETGSSFVADCPAADAESRQILGCYHDGRIYVLAVTRPEVAPVVPVTAAHEMLHAVYEAASDADRIAVDSLLADFYAATTDERLEAVVAQYDARTPQNRSTELHSLVPTQVSVLGPMLDEYYADYFRDRTPMLAAYDTYMTLFDGLIARYRRARGPDRRPARPGHGTASGVRRRGRPGETRSQGRSTRCAPRVGSPSRTTWWRARTRPCAGPGRSTSRPTPSSSQFNGLVSEINDVAGRLGGLESSLRPLGLTPAPYDHGRNGPRSRDHVNREWGPPLTRPRA